MCTMDPCTRADFVFNCSFSLYAWKLVCALLWTLYFFFFYVLIEIPFSRTVRSFSSWNGDNDDYNVVAVCWHPFNAFHSYRHEKCSALFFAYTQFNRVWFGKIPIIIINFFGNNYFISLPFSLSRSPSAFAGVHSIFIWQLSYGLSQLIALKVHKFIWTQYYILFAPKCVWCVRVRSRFCLYLQRSSFIGSFALITGPKRASNENGAKLCRKCCERVCRSPCLSLSVCVCVCVRAIRDSQINSIKIDKLMAITLLCYYFISSRTWYSRKKLFASNAV